MLRPLLGNDRIHKSALTMIKPPSHLKFFYKVTLTAMTVIKRRPDAADPCDPEPSDDARIWNAVFNSLTCLPSYWKMFSPVNSTLLPCQDFEQFNKLRDWTSTSITEGGILDERFANKFRGTKAKQKVLSSIATPCNEMEIVVTPQRREQKVIQRKMDVVTFNVGYQMQHYQEIRNEKDYGLDSLWSNIGGFLGIFVGYSLLNLLNDGYDLITYLLKVDCSLKISAKISQK